MARDALTWCSDDILSVYTGKRGYCLYEENVDCYRNLIKPFRLEDEIEIGPKVIVEWTK